MESVRLLPAVPGTIAGAPTYSTTAIGATIAASGSGYVPPGLIRSVHAGALRRPSAHGIAIEQQHQHWQAQPHSQPLSWRQALRSGGPVSKSAAISLGLGQRIRVWPIASSGSCGGLSGRGFGSNLVLVRAAADGEAPGTGSVGSGGSPLRSVSVSASASSSPAGTSTTRSDARTEKLMKMQKELLEQLEERRKLHAALLKSLDDPSKTIAAFNDSNQGGLPPVGSVAATPAVATTQVPRPAAKPPTGPPPPAVAATRTIPPASRPAPVAPRPGVSPQVPSPLRSIPAAPSTRPAPPPPAAAAAAPSAAPVRPATSPISVPIPSAPPPPNRGQAPPPPAPQRKAPPPPAAAAPAPVAPTRAAPAAPPPRAAAPAAAPAAPPPVRAPPPPAVPRPAAVVKAPVAIPSAPPLPPAVKREEAKPKPVAVAETRPADPPVEEKPPPLAGPNVMNIVMVASECAPWSKTGGLGDVVGALPKALARRGHRVMVCAPRYSAYEEAFDTGVRKRYNVAGQDLEVGYFHHYKDNVDWVFVDNNVFHHLPNIYAGSREEVTKRMTLLCKASIEACWHVPCGGVPYGDGNLVFIANDWHTALLPVYLQAYYRDHGLMQFARSILVIHNMAHQGRGPVAEYGRLGLPDHYLDRFKLYDPIGGEHMNIFMAGLISAHKIVAVSHGYAWEVQTQMGGWGLDAVLREHNQKLRGVVNGIDTVEWGPDSDSFLNEEDGYTHYDMDSLDKKAQCKAALQRELGLPVRPDVPLIGFIGRLDYQKGVDIIGEAMPWITSQDCQLVLLGSGRADLEDMLRSFEGSHREKVRGWVGFSVKMAHRITAGADILLMPSRFEPCGLNQLYAMRYGTVPVVHAVGGLRDTVQAFDPFNDTGLGWTFDRAEAGGLIHALGNAMYTYREFKDSWRKLQLRGMAQDLSWDNAAQQYEEVLVAAKYTW